MEQKNIDKFLHLAGFLHKSGVTHHHTEAKALRADATQLMCALCPIQSQGCSHLGGDCYHMALESNPKTGTQHTA